MEKEYLVTFKATTAALRAKLVVDETPTLEHELKETAEVVPVPFGLSATCFGMGLKCKTNDEGIQGLYDCLTENKVDFKNFWLVGKEYTPFNQRLERK